MDDKVLYQIVIYAVIHFKYPLHFLLPQHPPSLLSQSVVGSMRSVRSSRRSLTASTPRITVIPDADADDAPTLERKFLDDAPRIIERKFLEDSPFNNNHLD